jgi:hypothetical protein
MHIIRTILFIHILALLTMSSLSGQSFRPQATNITMDVAKDQVVIRYDLLGADTGKIHCITVFFSDIDLTNRIHPTEISGDIGCGIRCGSNKTVVWDISKDRQVVDMALQCNVLIDGVWGDGKTGGPGYAALSLIIPGLGDYFVADRRQMSFKPWMRTTLALGLVGIGVLSAEKRFREQRMSGGHLIYKYDNISGGMIPVWVPGRLVNGPMNYYLFKDDAEVLITAGATIWLADVLWVMNRGRRNQKAVQLWKGKGEAMLMPYLGLGPGNFQVGLSLSL